MAKKYAGLDKRHRDRSGGIEGNTRIATLRKTYGSDFAKGYHGDAKLSTVLGSTGTSSLSEYLEHSKRGKSLGAVAPTSDVSNTIFSHTTVIFEPALKNLAKK
jgi:hypothetical protein